MTRPCGPPETASGRKGWKQKPTGKPTDWATNLSPSNPRLHNEPLQREGVPWKFLDGLVSGIQTGAWTSHADRPQRRSQYGDTVEDELLMYYLSTWSFREALQRSYCLGMLLTKSRPFTGSVPVYRAIEEMSLTLVTTASPRSVSSRIRTLPLAGSRISLPARHTCRRSPSFTPS